MSFFFLNLLKSHNFTTFSTKNLKKIMTECNFHKYFSSQNENKLYSSNMDIKLSLTCLEFEKVNFKQTHIAVLLINMSHKKIVQYFSECKNQKTIFYNFYLSRFKNLFLNVRFFT